MNAHGDFKGGITKNFEGLIFAENEVGYEAGYIAALMAQKDGKTTVSSVGGIPVPAVVRYIAATRPARRRPSRASSLERLLAGLRRAGQVQEHRARPDLQGL